MPKSALGRRRKLGGIRNVARIQLALAARSGGWRPHRKMRGEKRISAAMATGYVAANCGVAASRKLAAYGYIEMYPSAKLSCNGLASAYIWLSSNLQLAIPVINC